MTYTQVIKDRAILLRKKGFGYKEICLELGLSSKSTLNAWFKDIDIPENSKLLIKENTTRVRTNNLRNTHTKSRLRIETEKSENLLKGISDIGTITQRELILIAAALYWGEGTKSESNTSVSLRLTNSDPTMIRLYMRFLREILKVDDTKIRAGIHIYPSINENEARDFWATATGLPRDRFYIVTQISRSSKNKRPSHLLQYGTVVIRVNSRSHFFRVKGMIEGIKQYTESL